MKFSINLNRCVGIMGRNNLLFGKNHCFLYFRLYWCASLHTAFVRLAFVKRNMVSFLKRLESHPFAWLNNAVACNDVSKS